MSNRWRPFKLKFSAILLPTFWTNRIPRNIYMSLPCLQKGNASSSCNCLDKNDYSDNCKVFSSFESSIKVFDNTFGNYSFLINTVLLKVLIVCIQTGSVRNGWKFAAVKWTELDLYGITLWDMSKRRMLLSQLDSLHDFQSLSSLFRKWRFEKFVKILSPQKFKLFECFSIWFTTLFTCMQRTVWNFC